MTWKPRLAAPAFHFSLFTVHLRTLGAVGAQQDGARRGDGLVRACEKEDVTGLESLAAGGEKHVLTGARDGEDGGAGHAAEVEAGQAAVDGRDACAQRYGDRLAEAGQSL